MVVKVQINLWKNVKLYLKSPKINAAFQLTVGNCHERIYDDRESLSFRQDTRSLSESNRLFLDLQRHHYTLDTNWDLKSIFINSNNRKK